MWARHRIGKLAKEQLFDVIAAAPMASNEDCRAVPRKSEWPANVERRIAPLEAIPAIFSADAVKWMVVG